MGHYQSVRNFIYFANPFTIHSSLVINCQFVVVYPKIQVELTVLSSKHPNPKQYRIPNLEIQRSEQTLRKECHVMLFKQLGLDVCFQLIQVINKTVFTSVQHSPTGFGNRYTYIARCKYTCSRYCEKHVNRVGYNLE